MKFNNSKLFLLLFTVLRVSEKNSNWESRMKQCKYLVLTHSDTWVKKVFSKLRVSSDLVLLAICHLDLTGSH